MFYSKQAYQCFKHYILPLKIIKNIECITTKNRNNFVQKSNLLSVFNFCKSLQIIFLPIAIIKQ